MRHGTGRLLLPTFAALALIVWATSPLPTAANGKHHKATAGDHVHASVPPEYADTRAAQSVWANPDVLARGREIYLARCAVCHGQDGKGDGPAAAALPLK